MRLFLIFSLLITPVTAQEFSLLGDSSTAIKKPADAKPADAKPFKIQLDNGKTVIVAPSIADADTSQITPPLPLPPKVVRPYATAYKAHIRTDLPLVIFICANQDQIDYISVIVAKMIELDIEQYMHIAIVNSKDDNYAKIASVDRPLIELVVWRSTDGIGKQSRYATITEFKDVCDRIIKWLHDVKKDNSVILNWDVPSPT